MIIPIVHLPRQRFSFKSKKAYNGTSHDKGPFYLNYPANIVKFSSFLVSIAKH